MVGQLQTKNDSHGHHNDSHGSKKSEVEVENDRDGLQTESNSSEWALTREGRWAQVVMALRRRMTVVGIRWRTTVVGFKRRTTVVSFRWNRQ